MESSGDSLEGASPRTNSTSNTGDNDDLQTQQLNCAECYESFHRNISTITSKAPGMFTLFILS